MEEFKIDWYNINRRLYRLLRYQAIQLYNSVGILTGGRAAAARKRYAEKFQLGSIAQDKWNTDGIFILGIEYGMLIALVEIFELTPIDVISDLEGK